MTNDLARWLLKQYNLLATDEMPDLHLRTCQTHKRAPSPMPTVIADTPMTCDCPALDWWLKDLAAKRKLVEAHADDHDCVDSQGRGMWTNHTDEWPSCSALTLLGEAVAHRPGYREAWRPS